MTPLVAILLAQCSCNYYPDGVAFGGTYTYAPGLRASIDAYKGVATGGPVFPDEDGRSVELVSRRTDTAPGVIVRTQHWVDGGVVFQVNAHNCGNSAPVFQVTAEGTYFGGSATPQCGGNSDMLAGALVHQNGYSGAVALYKPGGAYLTIAGTLGELRAVLPNGEQPNPLDYPAGWVMQDDAGYFFPYAGLHGNVTSMAIAPMHAGQLAEWKNPTGDGYRAHRAGIDHNGGYWQNHGLSRSQFPSPRVETTLTSLGQYRFMMLGTLYFAETERHWYFTDGEQWLQLAEQREVDVLRVQVSALEARVSALEAQHP